MEAKIGKLFESVTSFFGGGDQIPWCDRDVIAGCEREVAEANEGASEERKNESILRLSWALVHSRQSEDINRGIAMLEVGLACHFAASLINARTPLDRREKLYLLAVGYYRSGEYARSRQLVEQCLEIAPDWRQALTLKKTVEDQIGKDGIIGIGITATAVGLIAAGIAAAVSRRG
ncbi:Mitochondrial fission 1 protein A [Cucurbita argyrosperma subsp. argyrosperma]|nr:Mitochondrial fission 1 protein A [Cucurbita argyrosperma subsp. argyrosperma]